MTAIIGLVIGNISGSIVMATVPARARAWPAPDDFQPALRFGVKGAALPLLGDPHVAAAGYGHGFSPGQAINRMLFDFSAPARPA